MFVVAFAYPHADARPFDLRHFLDVHLPMGVALCQRHLDLTPEKIVVHGPLRAGDGAAPILGAVSHVYFRTLDEAEKFLTLFAYPEAAQKLIADFPNYTAGPPQVLIGEVHGLDDIQGLCDQALTRGLI
jgi:hypothetical protein